MEGENYIPRTGNGSQNYCHTLHFYPKFTIRIINIILVARKSSVTLNFNFFQSPITHANTLKQVLSSNGYLHNEALSPLSEDETKESTCCEKHED